MPVSDAPRPDENDQDAIDAAAFDAVVRSSPRYGRFIGTGVAFGIGFGFILGFALPNGTGVGRGIVGLLLALGFSLIFGLSAAAIATRLDGKPPAPAPFPWELDPDTKEAPQ